MQLLSQENAQLKMEKAAKQMEQQGKMQIPADRGQHKLDAKTMDFITQVVKAELAAKSKATDVQAQQDADRELADLGFHHEMQQQGADQAHEHAMAGVEAQNAQTLAQQQATNAQVTQASDQAHQQTMAEQAQSSEAPQSGS